MPQLPIFFAYLHNNKIVNDKDSMNRNTITILSICTLALMMSACSSEKAQSQFDAIEIWAKEEFERSGISNEEFIALAGKLSER